MVRRNPKYSLAVLLTGSLAVAACGRSVAPENLPDIDGAWNYSETQSAERGTVICNIVGTLGFVQEGENLVGSYSRTLTCSRPTGLTSRVESGQLNGRVYETSVQFRLANCDYRGTFSSVRTAGTRPERITGTTLCSGGFETAAVADGGASSAWSADRLAEETP